MRDSSQELRWSSARTSIAWLTAGFLVFSLPSSAPAQTAPDTRKVEIGFEERFRNEDWNNATDMSDRTNDEREQLRYRTRVWFSAPLPGSIDFLASLMDESSQKMGQVNHLDEIFFDNLYFDFHKVFIKGLDLKVGRQNIQRSEGFILWDGTPGDGSRTGYYNAANLNYTTRKSTIELIGIFDPARDRFLPRWHDQHRTLQTWDEQALGLYYTDRNHARAAFDAYYFYKKEVHDIRPSTNPQFQPDRHVSTGGGRVVIEPAKNWAWTTEAAYQWGAQHGTATRGPATIGAWGGYSHLKRTLDRPWKPYIKVGFVALSGDDPSSKNRIEGWDPLFSQWAKWSEMYVYSEGKEVGSGYWTNLGMTQLETGFAPHRKINVRFTWYHMDAFHAFAGSPATFGTGSHRGENFQTRTEFNLRPDLKAYVHYETQRAGNFYTDRPAAFFVQAQVTYQFRYHPAL